MKTNTVDGSPTKSFFVEMLTRDISLTDCILDLLDNCVDGIQRISRARTGKKFEGFKVGIDFNENEFSITDNCGGIPWDLADYAFRMGRPKDYTTNRQGMLGTYGIGLKRAVFKIGQEIRILTKTEKDEYAVEIDKPWIGNEKTWDLPVNHGKTKLSETGTKITVRSLLPAVKDEFYKAKKDFEKDLYEKISSHFCRILDNGLEVEINKTKVSPKPVTFAFNPKTGIKPYVFKGDRDGVSVLVVIGFYKPISSEEEYNSDESRFSSETAGITIFCNDRAVLYCDKTQVVGWGTERIPMFHPQYNAIAGTVDFFSKDPRSLPTTTTKRGIDLNSAIFWEVRGRIREGLRKFIDFTNQWKEDVVKAKEKIQDTEKVDFEGIKERVNKGEIKLSSVSKWSGGEGKQSVPDLPKPPRKPPEESRIAYKKKPPQVKTVAEYLFGKEDVDPSKVGEECFDRIYKEAIL